MCSRYVEKGGRGGGRGGVIGREGGVKCEVCGHTWFQASNRLQVLSQGYVLKERRREGMR